MEVIAPGILQVLAFKLIEALLEELAKDNAIVVSIQGPLKDSATVAVPTFVGGMVLGPVGAVLGAFTGTGILTVTKLLGYGHYKPLMNVLKEECSEAERSDLYGRLWTRLQGFVTCPLNQAMAYSALKSLTTKVEKNPEIMQDIKNEIKVTLGKRNLTLN